jgi:hypothetical protein
VGKELGIGEFEILEIFRSKGIDTWTCSDKRDLMNIIISKPIVTAAAADTHAVGLDVLPDVAVHSLTLETGLNGLQSVCPPARCCLGLLVDKNRLSTTVDKTNELSISERLLMIVYKILKLANEVRVKLAPRSIHSHSSATFPDMTHAYSGLTFGV